MLLFGVAERNNIVCVEQNAITPLENLRHKLLEGCGGIRQPNAYMLETEQAFRSHECSQVSALGVQENLVVGRCKIQLGEDGCIDKAVQELFCVRKRKTIGDDSFIRFPKAVIESNATVLLPYYNNRGHQL